jgi:AraC-like DNA-binding protein
MLLSFIFFVNPMRVNKKANLWFGATLLLWSSFWLDEILVLTHAQPLGALTVFVLSCIQFFTPVLLYVSILFFTNPTYKFKAKDGTLFILPLVYLVILILNRTTQNDYKTFLLVLTLSHAILYTTKSYIKLRMHQRKITLFSSNTDEIDLKWLENIILVLFLLVMIISVFNLIYMGTPLKLYLKGMMLVAILFVAYSSLKQKEIFPVNVKHRDEVIAIDEDVETANTTKRKILNDEELVALTSKLHALMKEKQLYLDNDINLASLSEAMDITPHQLSYIINNGFHQNFFQFVNTYRIDKAKSLLLDKSLRKMTILGIAYESGFNSKTAFNTTFKKFTNQTPSEFKKTEF